VFASDIHTGRWRDRAETDSIIADINAAKPDLIILGGDYVGGRRDGARDFYPAAATLRAPLGVYAIAGNHDYWEDRDNLSEYVQSSGITLL
jgi:predicted MPP superfamily phosphohydrolase